MSLLAALLLLPTAPAPVPLTPVQEIVRVHDSEAGQRPDVAWDGETRTFALSWCGPSSLGLAHYAAIFDQGGSAISRTSRISAGGRLNTGALCNVAAGNLFVHAWTDPRDPLGFLYSADLHLTGFPSGSPPSTANLPTIEGIFPDIGGDALSSSGATCTVMIGRAYLDHVDLGASLVSAPDTWSRDPEIQNFAFYGVGQEREGFPTGAPRISQSNGISGHWLVTWTEVDRRGIHSVLARTLHRSGSLGPIATLLPDAEEPSCDGDGNAFLVAELTGEGTRIEVQQLKRQTGDTLVTIATRTVESGKATLSSPQVAMSYLSTFETLWWVVWIGTEPGGVPTAYAQAFTDVLEPKGERVVLADGVQNLRIASLRSALPYSLGETAVAIALERNDGVWFWRND